MKKTLIVMIDEIQHEELRKESFDKRISMAAIVRKLIDTHLGKKENKEQN